MEESAGPAVTARLSVASPATVIFAGTRIGIWILAAFVFAWFPRHGGGFGTMPSFTADFFGSTFMGGIYGWILLAWGAAAVPSPMLIAHFRQTTGRYDVAIYAVAAAMVIAVDLPLSTKRPHRRIVVEWEG